jgi:hypothetical protein
MSEVRFINLGTRSYAGFTDNELIVHCKFGDTLDNILKKLNEFRQPKERLINLYSINDKLIPESGYKNIAVKDKLIINVR